MRHIRKRLTYANAMSSIAVFLVLGGASALAAGKLGKNTVGAHQLKKNAVTSAKVKNGSLRSVDFKVGQLPTGARGAQGPQGPKGDPGPQGKQGPAGAPGSALGYAYINSAGEMDPALSKNVTASNVTESGTGFFCFGNLPFSPRSVVAALDYHGLLNGQIPVVTTTVPGDTFSCGGPSQAMVFTGLVEPGVFTKGADIGFYVLFN